MKKGILASLFLFSVLALFSQKSEKKISVIPEPVSMTRGVGYFKLPEQISVSIPNLPALKQTSESVLGKLAATGKKVTLTNSKTATIRFELIANADKNLIEGNEGYKLSVTNNGILISANGPAGLFYGAQTLWQLLPQEIESKSRISGVIWQAPVVEITDYPRFKWRGLMLDVSRHFFTKKQVEDFIDVMVQYKFNLIHLTLANDEGWRIEIKSLPRLTSVGAWRPYREGTWGTFAPIPPDEPKTYGGFYTQEDMRGLIKYAQDRFVNILPEIDVPGHSMAAVVAYPELSCTPGADKYQVIAGAPFMDWPGPKGRVDNTLCPANEKVYTFLDTVYTEIAKLFPFEFIHVGGDECAKNFWEQNDQIKALMIKENLKTMEEVQSYFEKRVEKIVESKGKKMIGWDEILEGGLAPNAVVMSWRGIKGGVAAAKMGHQIVMSPTTYVYLDFMQGDAISEAPVYSTLRLNKTYEFEPVPEGVDPKYVLGGQGNLWTEQVYNTRHMQYMLWPRSLAISESLWSPKANKNWSWFANKVENNFGRMDLQNVKYARTMFDPIFEVSKAPNDSMLITLSTEIEGLDIHYSFDNSHPDNFYPVYKKPLLVPKDAVMLKVITYRGNQVMGKELDMPVFILKRRLATGNKNDGNILSTTY